MAERRALLLLVAAVALRAAAAAPNADAQRLSAAEGALTHAVEASGGVPKDILEDASCIGVFPDASKADFQAGKSFARGIVTCRRPDGTMGAPAFFRLMPGRATWGFDGDHPDLILLVMSPAARARLASGRVALGPGSSAVGGPVGRDLSNPAQLQAEMLSWSATGSAVAGVSLDGNVIAQDTEATTVFYGSPITAKSILGDPRMAPPHAAASFVRLTTEYANPAS
jgi:SH3 domain-containing YSC84-like protein 1